MKFIQLKIVPFLRKNIEIFLLIFLLIISVFITQLYNMNVKKVQKDYLEILRNSYFKKSISYLFSNLKPKYEDIEYKVKTGDTLVSILKSFSVNKYEVQKIVEILNNTDIKNLNPNSTLKFTLENTDNLKNVNKILIPITKSRKLEIFKDIKNNTFTKKRFNHKFRKENSFKRGCD